MNRPIRGLIGSSLLLVACKSREAIPAKAQLPSSSSAPEVVFYVPPLVEASRARFTSVSEWSQNDDRDTIYVVLRGGSLESAVLGVSIDALVRRVSLADEAENVVPKDTIGRRVEWQRRVPIRADSLPKLGDGVLLKILQPSQIDRSVPGVDTKADEHVVVLRVTVLLPSGAEVTRTVKLLPSV